MVSRLDETLDAMSDLLGRFLKSVCARCGSEQSDLRPWPPDATTDQRRYCGTCRCRMAARCAK